MVPPEFPEFMDGVLAAIPAICCGVLQSYGGDAALRAVC